MPANLDYIILKQVINKDDLRKYYPVADGLRQQYYKIILSSTIYKVLPRGLVTAFYKVFFTDCIIAGQKGCNNPGKF